MIDVQSLPDYRQIEVDKVGIKDIRYPITVLDRENGTQKTVAYINMYVGLPHRFKGTHMSRFVEILNEYQGELISFKSMKEILHKMKERLNAVSAHLEIEFPYFMEKKAPVSKTKGLMEYLCTFIGNLRDKIELELKVRVPICTLCPCSKEISEFGAHNQRGIVNLRLRFRKFIWLEDIIKLVEQAGSSEVYSLLKRVDEKYVTEKAYQNPKFVEDVVREIAKKLLSDDNITWFAVEAENFESIHNHSAYAYIERKK
ncbi:GTP cyclohydrolase [Candidatus Desulfofervidus auxilii]|nr:GTP cyclohydrolase [Candidatus Desulfofervidus auxilii]CAD7774467.1 MAG: GTP cyclohydrolase FolE2 [Candidatus Methanoperedenaceae archaeon GB50]CAD7780039.1 GTP cyclohydrolase FolE2 [Candidatus Methanoperedenaceae archaeon GB50]CAD7781300.1 GTP cyclohydrolase FolE2 [Candidatus Methanoperedenaceae archaeon GB37]